MNLLCDEKVTTIFQIGEESCLVLFLSISVRQNGSSDEKKFSVEIRVQM